MVKMTAMGIKISTKFIISEIINYLEIRGFGSFNKNDFEVLIFQSLLKSDENLTDYQYSRLLKIPESKVSRLRYEADLKYGNPKGKEKVEIDSTDKEEMDYNQEVLCKFLKLLSKAKFKALDSQKIQFQIRNKALRLYLENILDEDGRFSDSSFNSNIVTISFDDLKYLINSFVQGKKILSEIEEKAKQTLKENVKGELEIKTFKALLPQLILESIKMLGNSAKLASTIINPYSSIDTIGGMVIEAFKKLKIINKNS